MPTKLTRRSMLLGAAGASLLAGGCQQRLSNSDDSAFSSFSAERDLLGPQPGEAQLCFNENPYGPAPSALKMIEYAGKKGAYYPGKIKKQLATMIADRHGLKPENVVISAGSAEALSAVAVVYGQQGPIITPRLFFDPTVMYAKRLGLANIDRVDLDSGFNIDLAAIEARVTSDTGLVQLCNPNNPTGLLIDSATLKASVKRMARKTTVVIDEAYMELTEDPDANTCVDLIKQGDDVIIARTFSKIYGLAGLRVGYLLTGEETAAKIRSAVMSWTSSPALAAALGCYNDQAFLDYSKANILTGREMIMAASKASGIETLPSHTNFVFFKSGNNANDIKAAFREKNILISGQYMDYNEWSRVSVGKLEDVERFCTELPKIVS